MRKGMSFGDMSGAVIVFVVTAVILGFGAVILTGIGTGLTGDAATVVANGTDGLLKFGEYLPTLALVIIGAIVIGVLVRSFM